MTSLPSLDRVRVIHLATYGGPYAGSFIPAIRALAKAVQERGGSFEIAFSPGARGREWLHELERDGIAFTYAPARPWPDGFVWLSRRLRGDQRLTVIHSHFTGYDLMSAAVGAVNRPSTAVFWHVHSRIKGEALPRARNVVKYALLARGVDQILCVSPDIAEAVRRRGARRRRIRMLPNAIDLGRFPPATVAERAQARRSLGLSAEGRVLLHFGWDWDRKGGDIFLQAVKALRDRGGHDGLLAVTVGAGANAGALATKLGIDAAVRVLPARDDVRTFYAAADIFVSCSRAEGMPFSMIEALACGLRVVASDLPGQALIGHDVAACDLVGLDADEIADAIQRQLGDGERGGADVETTRAVLGDKVDLGAWTQQVLDVYLEALASHLP